MYNRFVFCLFALAAVGSANAGEVVVELNGTLYRASTSLPAHPVQFSGAPASPNATVELGAIGSATMNIRVYDDGVTASTGPTLPMGWLKINGSATASGRVNVLVAAPMDTAGQPVAFPTTLSLADSLRPGLTDFGGTVVPAVAGVDYGDIAHDWDSAPWATTDTLPSGTTTTFPGWSDPYLRGLLIPNPSLRRQTLVAIVVSGDLCPGGGDGNDPTGRIEAGQIVRVAALGSQSGGVVSGGNINAHIIAASRDNFLSYSLCQATNSAVSRLTTFKAIETIKAGNAIRGKIVAQGRARDDVTGGSGGTMGQLYERTPDLSLYNPLDPGSDGWTETPPCNWVASPGSFNPLFYPAWIDRGSIANIVIAPAGGAVAGDITNLAERTIGRGGIQHDIQSRFGRIYSIRTWGPIGKPPVPSTPPTVDFSQVSITAADGVLEVRAEPFASQAYSPSETIKNFVSEIKSAEDVQVLDDPASGVVHTVTTNGDIGFIKCLNLIYNPQRTDKLGRCGVITRGGFPTAIDGSALNCALVAHDVSIIAHHIGGVAIGHHFKGAMIAHGDCVDPVPPSVDYVKAAGLDYRFNLDIGSARGTIGGVSVGATELDPLVFPNITRFERGFVGGFGPPVDLRPTPFGAGELEDTTPTPWHGKGIFINNLPTIRMFWDPDRWHFVRPHPLDGGAVDSVIHAETSIGAKGFYLYSMTQTTGVNEKDEPIVAPYKPRVEAPSIISLWIGDDEVLDPSRPVRGGMIDGVVWSGLLEYRGGVPDNYADEDPEGRNQGYTGIWRDNDYAIIGNLKVARMSPSADIWMALLETGSAFGATAYVFEHMCGEMHFQYAAPTGYLEIGGKLGRADDFTDWPYHSHAGTEASPRGLAATHRTGSTLIQEATEADYGTVYFRGAIKAAYTNDVPVPPPPPHVNVPRLRFEGPVIVHSKWQPQVPPASPDHAAYWRGRVVEGDPWSDYLRDPSWLSSPQNMPTGQLVLGPDDLLHPENAGPFYSRRAGTLLGIALDSSGAMIDNLARDYGGSVGVFPLRVHQDDSKPLGNGDDLTAQGVTTSTWFAAYAPSGGRPMLTTDHPPLFARFYGPLDDFAAPGYQGRSPVVFEHRENGVWTKVFNLFEIDLRYPSGAPSQWRDVVIGPVCDVNYLDALGLYRMRQPEPDDDEEGEGWELIFERVRALNSGGHAEKPPVDTFAFYFVLTCSAADVGQQGGVAGPDGVLDNNDFVVFIDWFFGHDPRADIGQTGGIPGHDNAWDNNDFVVFIDLFFSADCVEKQCACPNGFAGRASGGGNMMNRSVSEEEERAAQMAARANALRTALETMIAAEPPGPRRDQLLEMLNALPPVQP